MDVGAVIAWLRRSFAMIVVADHDGLSLRRVVR
jgi:hypothetical protein